MQALYGGKSPGARQREMLSRVFYYGPIGSLYIDVYYHGRLYNELETAVLLPIM
jgi:hypothetical protein